MNQINHLSLTCSEDFLRRDFFHKIDDFLLKAFRHYYNLTKEGDSFFDEYEAHYQNTGIQMHKSLTYYVESAPLMCGNFSFTIEFLLEQNFVNLYCTSTGGHGEYKPVKIFSGRIST